MDMDAERQALAEEVQRRRKARGWSKERAARESDISSITWKRIEDGLPVQDVKLDAALRALEMTGSGATIMIATATGQAPADPVGRGGDPDAVLPLDGMTADQRRQVREFAEFITRQNPDAR